MTKKELVVVKIGLTRSLVMHAHPEPGRIHEGRQGAKRFENLSVWFGPEAGVLVVWRVERLWQCQDGQGQRGFRLPEVSFGQSSAVRLLKPHLNGSEGMARMAKELG